MKEVPEHPGYFVDRAGNVFSNRRGQMRQLQPIVNGYGYLVVKVPVDGKFPAVGVHRLVLMAYVGPCPEGCETRHLNGIRTDNRLENLAWGTRLEQAADKKRHGTQASGPQKLPSNRVKRIQQLYATGNYTQDELAEMFGVSQSFISKWTTEKLGNRGERNGQAKFGPDTVRKIRHLAAQGLMYKTIAQRFNVGPMCISRIVKRERWAHLD